RSLAPPPPSCLCGSRLRNIQLRGSTVKACRYVGVRSISYFIVINIESFARAQQGSSPCSYRQSAIPAPS
ncbi:MAG: hypothetical protein LBK99_04630, partial [Opitutaceae bacterium]|nr:hypothetical protein [Opitutaceae bacterium]